MRYAPCVVVALYVVLLAKPSALAQGQPCNDLQAVPGAIGYQRRSVPERCEGFFQSPVAGESLELLSLVHGSIEYDLQTDNALIVAVPDVGQLEATAVHVRARALPLGTYYRMDATVATAQTLEWPLNAVIAPAKLSANSLGVIGWIEKGATKVYVPVSVRPLGKPPAPQHPAIALLRSLADIEEVQWRLQATGTTAQPPPWQVLARNMIRAGEPVSLPIATSSQLWNLEIAAKMAHSGDWLKTRLRVFIP
jgi:hypothetical protein